MTFFNKKEDVMKIELTPYGRELLSKGKLMPAYYSFFDDDIIYNSSKASFSQNNSEIKNRILNDTPSLKPQTNYKGVESQFFDSITPERENILINPIGTNYISEKKSASWRCHMLHGEISSSLGYVSSSTSAMHNIPQLECEINYTASINYQIDLPSDKVYITSLPDENNKVVELLSDHFITHIYEKNGFDHKEAFEVEVYLYEQDEKSLKKLKFIKRKKDVIDGILMEDEPHGFDIDQILNKDGPSIEGDPVDFVETYINCFIDDEIEDLLLCKSRPRIEEYNIYMERALDCPDILDEEIDIYNTSVEYEECEDE